MVIIKYTDDGSGQMFCQFKRQNARTVWNTEPYKEHYTCIQAILGLIKDTGGSEIRVQDHVNMTDFWLRKDGSRKMEKKLDHRSLRK